MLRRSIIGLVGLGLAACDTPSEPRWEQTWVLPAERLTISVAELLPADVGLSEDGTAFRVSIPPVAITATLGEMCPACALVDGTTAPKPAFTATLVESSPLPSGLVAAVLAGGMLELAVEHDFDFDPLRPSSDAAQRGYILLSVTSDGVLVARDSVSGDDTAFPAGAPLTSTLPVQPVVVSGSLDLEIRLHSPAGDPVQVRSADALVVTMAGTQLDVSAVTIEATDLDLGATTTNLDLELDEWLVERIRRGALRLNVENPFDLTGTLNLRLDAGSTVVERSVTVDTGSFTRRLDLSGSELRDLMGAATLAVTTSGNVTAPGGTVTVTPTQELVLEPSLELVVLMGGREEDT